MFWLTLLPIWAGLEPVWHCKAPFLAQSSLCAVQRGTPGAAFWSGALCLPMGVAAIPLIKANTKKVGHAALSLG